MVAADSMQLDVPVADPSTLTEYLLYIPKYYALAEAQLLKLALHDSQVLAQGVTFSGALLGDPPGHEMGHYLACRRYGVSATLRFFIPAPPLFLAGTFGAFIKIKVTDSLAAALFDIGLAGPLAGFVVALPIAAMGILSLHPVPTADHQIVFNDPLSFRLLARVFGAKLDATGPNPYDLAAWIGLLVTSLNLMPVGQLDGGHGTFAVFGLRVHKWVGRIAFVAMALLAVLGWFWHGSPSGFLYTVLLAIMLKVRHPQPQQMEPLGGARVMIAILTLLVFVLSFWPFPITIK